MAGKVNPVIATVVDEVLSMRSTKLSLHGGCLTDFIVEFVVAPAFATGKVNPRLFDILPLALPRCVVHHGNQRKARMPVKRREKFDGIGCRKLASHMEMVIGAQQLLIGTRV